MIYYIKHEYFSKGFSSLLNALETVTQAEINMSSNMGDSLFKLGRYNRVFLEIWAQIPMWAPMFKRWAVGSFFSWKYSRRAHRAPQKRICGRNGDHHDLEWPMLSYYVIYCEKFRKVLQRTEKVALTRAGTHRYAKNKQYCIKLVLILGISCHLFFFFFFLDCFIGFSPGHF